MLPRILAVSLLLGSQTALYAQTRPPAKELSGLFPADARVEQFALTTDSARTYYTTLSGDIWLYDRQGRTAERITIGNVWDLALSPRGDAIAYTRRGDLAHEQHVWLQPLDLRTGLATGRERRVSANADVPSFSPDGQRIAFARNDASGVGQSVVIAPVSGGAERVVAPNLPSSVGHIRWTPDGRALYFGVNPPVPFTCAESCITIPGGNRDVPGSIRRVSVDGGAITVVATTASPNPGLSPDGSVVVFADTGRSRRLVIAAADGRRLDTLSVTPLDVPSWFGRSTLLTTRTGQARRLYNVALPRGEAALLFQGNGPTWTPIWSPDGKTVAVVHRIGNSCEYRLLRPNGSLQKILAGPTGECGFFPAWTADQRWIAHRKHPFSGPPGIAAIEIEPGRFTELRAANAADVDWTVDSDAVIVTEIPIENGARRGVLVWQIGFDGGAKLLREVPIDNRPTWASPLDRSNVLVAQDNPAETRLIRLDGSNAERILRPAQSALFQPLISRDKEWVAFLRNRSGPDHTMVNTIELVRVDETDRRVVELPFFIQCQSIEIMPGGRTLIVAERAGPGMVPAIYSVDAKTGSSRRLIDYATGGRCPEFAAAPDGSAVLVMITQTLPPVVSAYDLSAIR